MGQVTERDVVSRARVVVGVMIDTVHNLREIRKGLKSAVTSIDMLTNVDDLENELCRAIKIMLALQNEALHEFNERVSGDACEYIQISLKGCEDCVKLLRDEVAVLMVDLTTNIIELRTKTRTIWNETVMRSYQHQLLTHTAALQLLLQIASVESLSGQAAILRQAESRQILEKCRDKTSTLHASVLSSAAPANVTSTTLSNRSPANESATGALEQENIKSALTQGSPAEDISSKLQYDTTSAEETYDARSPILRDLNINPKILLASRPTESANNSISEFTPITSATSRTDERWEIARKSPQASIMTVMERRPGRLHNLTSLRAKSSADTAPPQSPKTPLLPALKLRLSPLKLLWATKSPSSSGKTASSESCGLRGRRRPEHDDLNQSIDLISHGRLSAPSLVQAARCGNVIEIEQLIDEGCDLEARHVATGRTPLAIAAQYGHVDICQILVQRGAKPDTSDITLMTPLHLAALNNHCHVMECLLIAGAPLDVRGPSLMTPLHLAVEYGIIEAATFLLHKKAKVNNRDTQQGTPLHAAAKAGDEHMIEALLECGADVEVRDAQLQAPIHYAAAGNHRKIVEALLSKKASIECTGSNFKTPLMCAAESGAEDVVSFLLSRRASIKARGEAGMTALHYSARNGHTEVVELLTRKKSTIEARTDHGRTPLHISTMASKFASAELLIRKGAHIDATCNEMKQPLHYACEALDGDVVRLLLGSRVDIEAEANNGQRPIHIAALQGSVTIIRELLAMGAQLEARDASGMRALTMAVSQGHLELTKFLLDNDAAIRLRYQDRPGREDSPLCIASRFGHTAIVEELIHRGTSIGQRDEQSWQPLRYAAVYGWPDVVELLFAKGATVKSLSEVGSYGSSSITGRLGFAMDVQIDQERKARVLDILEQRSKQEQQTHPRRSPRPVVETSKHLDDPASHEICVTPSEPLGSVDDSTPTNMNRASLPTRLPAQASHPLVESYDPSWSEPPHSSEDPSIVSLVRAFDSLVRHRLSSASLTTAQSQSLEIPFDLLHGAALPVAAPLQPYSDPPSARSAIHNI